MTAATVGRNGGLYCYLMTPYDEDGAVNHDALERYVDAVIEGGVDGLKEAISIAVDAGSG